MVNCMVYCEVVWLVCALAGDEDVEEGEGQNENSGDSDEVPPKVTNYNTNSINNFIVVTLSKQTANDSIYLLA